MRKLKHESKQESKNRSLKRILEAKTLVSFSVPDSYEVMNTYKEDSGFDEEELEIYYDENGALTDSGYSLASEMIDDDIQNTLEYISEKYGSTWEYLDRNHLGDSFEINDVFDGSSDLKSIEVEEDSGVVCINMHFSDHDGYYSIIGCNQNLKDYIPKLSEKALVMWFKAKPQDFSWIYNKLLKCALTVGYNLDDDQKLLMELLDELGFDKISLDYDKGKKSKGDIQDWCKRHVTPTGIATALSKIHHSRQDIVLLAIMDDEDDILEMNAVAINKLFGNSSYNRVRGW